MLSAFGSPRRGFEGSGKSGGSAGGGTGPCWTSGYTSDTMQIVLTATRHDVAMISEGRFTQPPDYVVVARIVMTTKGALELAEAIKSTVAKHQAMTGRLHSSSGHA